MAKYQVGQEFQPKNADNFDDVWFKILFVCPVDGYGVQKYVTECLSGTNDGAKKKFISMSEEKDIDNYFDIRDREFVWRY